MKRFVEILLATAAIYCSTASGAELEFFSSTSSSSFSSSSSSSVNGEKPKTTFTSQSDNAHADSINGFSSRSTAIDKLSPTSDKFAIQSDKNDNGR